MCPNLGLQARLMRERYGCEVRRLRHHYDSSFDHCSRTYCSSSLLLPGLDFPPLFSRVFLRAVPPHTRRVQCPSAHFVHRTLSPCNPTLCRFTFVGWLVGWRIGVRPRSATPSTRRSPPRQQTTARRCSSPLYGSFSPFWLRGVRGGGGGERGRRKSARTRRLFIYF